MSDQPMSEGETPEPANLRFLRRLVTVLTATMIVGLIAIFVVLVIRLQSPTATFPDTLALPDGATVQALTRTDDALIAVTTDGRVFILTADGQTIRQTVNIE